MDKQPHELEQQLIDALLDGYTHASFERMLRLKLEKRVETIAAARSNFTDVVFAVVRRARQERWLIELINAAQEDNKTNARIQRLNREAYLGLKPLPPTTSPQFVYFGIIAAISLTILAGVGWLVQRERVLQPTTSSGDISDGNDQANGAIDFCPDSPAPRLSELGSMVIITGTTLYMGDDSVRRPIHPIDVATFLIDKYEVTNEQYRHFLADTQRDPPAGWVDRQFPDNQTGFSPVVNVSWRDAQAFCVWAHKRLPTEPEWELACRGEAKDGGTDFSLYPWGDEGNQYLSNSAESPCIQPPRVGLFAPYGDSTYQVSDMIGGVFEWVSSAHGTYPYDETRESAADPAAHRGFRGGSWRVNQSVSRCTLRGSGPSHATFQDGGFRCAQTIPAP